MPLYCYRDSAFFLLAWQFPLLLAWQFPLLLAWQFPLLPAWQCPFNWHHGIVIISSLLLLLVQSSFSEGVIIGRKRASEIWRGGGLFSGRFIFVYLRYLRTIIRTKTASSLSFIAKVNTFVSITYHYKISTWHFLHYGFVLAYINLRTLSTYLWVKNRKTMIETHLTACARVSPCRPSSEIPIQRRTFLRMFRIATKCFGLHLIFFFQKIQNLSGGILSPRSAQLKANEHYSTFPFLTSGWNPKVSQISWKLSSNRKLGKIATLGGKGLS